MIGRSAADRKPKAAAEPHGHPEAGVAARRRGGPPDRLLVRILALFCLAILPLAVLAGVIAARDDGLAVAIGRQASAASAALVLAQAQTDLTLVDRSLIGLATLPAVQGADPGACRQALEDAVAAMGGRLPAMRLVPSHGGDGCATEGSDVPPAVIASLARELAAPASGGMALRSLGPGMLVAGRRLLDAAGQPALLVATLRTDWLSPPPDPLHPVQGLWLVQPNGEVVALDALASGWPPPSPAMRKALVRNASQPVQSGDLLLSAAPVAGGRLLVVGSPAAPGRAGLGLVGGLTIELVAMLFAGLAIMAFGAGQVVIAPLTRLGRALARWRAGGGFDPGPVATMPHELRELAAALAGATVAIAEREQQLRVAGDQQELLIQEIHHRVKNNLQIVASLLNLQANRIRQPSARAEFQSARDRVRALATLHRHLYAQSELHAINMKSFLEELCGQLFQAMGEQRGRRITLDIAAPALRLSSDQAVPLALIVTEAVSNALKYAFPDGRSGHVSVRLTAVADAAELVIQDDGVGIPAAVAETETGPRDGLGLQLIRGFARQLGATLEVSEENGTRYVIRLPLRREGESFPAGATQADPEPA